MAEETVVTGFETNGNARTNLISSVLRTNLGLENAPIPAKRADKREEAREALVTRFHGSFAGLKQFYEQTLAPIRTFVVKDSEGVGSEADLTYGTEMRTLDGAPYYAHGVVKNGFRYYLNNSKVNVCPDYKEQIGPVLKQLESGQDHIKEVTARLHHDTRLFVDMTTDVSVEYHHDVRGSGKFDQHIILEACLSSEMQWSFSKMLFRQVCGNGMFAVAKTNVRSMKKTASFAERVAGFDITTAVPDFTNVFDRLQAKQLPPIEAWALQYLAKLPQQWQNVIMEQAALEGGREAPTAWCLYNALAYVIDHADVSDSTRKQFITTSQQIMGDVMHQRIQVAEA